MDEDDGTCWDNKLTSLIREKTLSMVIIDWKALIDFLCVHKIGFMVWWLGKKIIEKIRVMW